MDLSSSWLYKLLKDLLEIKVCQNCPAFSGKVNIMYLLSDDVYYLDIGFDLGR